MALDNRLIIPRSVNDAISRELCSVCYTSVDTAAELIHTLGKGCLLAKLDLREAYRAVPVHPSDQGLLAVSWRSTIYIDRALPFGLRSAPKIFSALTDIIFRILELVTAILGIHTTAKHLPGAQNTSADALSRNKLPLFFSLNPQASPVPAIVPQELRSLVFNTQLQWTSPSWVHLLSSSFITALRLPPAQLTDPPNAATRDSAINTESPSLPTTGGNIMQLCSVFSEGGPQTSYNQGIPRRNTVPTDTDIVRQPLSRWQHAPLGICPGRYQEG